MVNKVTQHHWRLQKNIILRRERTASLPGKVLAEQGQRVEAAQELARVEKLFSAPVVFDAARRVEAADPSELEPEDWCVQEGDRVKMGEPLVEVTHSVLGLFRSVLQAKSPTEGVIETIYPELGMVLIREDKETEKSSVTIPVSEPLQCSPDAIREHLRVNKGDAVRQGEIIAVAHQDIRNSVMAPFDGEILNIDASDGTVLLQRSQTEISVRAFLPGTVCRVIPQLGAVIESHVTRVSGVFGMGGEHSGTVRVLSEDSTSVLQKETLDDSMQNDVLVTRGAVTADAVLTAGQLGVAGIIAGCMRGDCVYDLTGQRMELGLTGSEPLSLAVIITEGFSENLSMNDTLFEVFSEYAGRTAYLNGTTQIRAGVVRPEILLPADEQQGPGEWSQSEDDISEGDQVLILRGPHFMRTGTVSKLMNEGVEMDSGLTGPAARVVLQGSREVLVMQANLERQV